jgi:succinate dehydrogenase/fumarate reductase cytochrome b subunit
MVSPGAFLQVLVLCLCAVVPPLFSLTGIFRPEEEAVGQWFQRSGAVMTAFAVFAHFKAGGIATMIAGTTFAETWEAYHKYNRLQALAAWLSLVLVVIGTLIWAYGDLLFPEPPDDAEEQTAIIRPSMTTPPWYPSSRWYPSRRTLRSGVNPSLFARSDASCAIKA